MSHGWKKKIPKISPALLNIVRVFRESITLKPAEISFRQGWEGAMSGETMPLDELWAGIGNDE